MNDAQGWHGSYDYRRLGAAADYLMLMTYDEHYQGGSSGPVASRSFQEQSIQYALKYVPADKLVLGLPFFGRIWSDSGSLMQGHGISESQIQTLIANYRGQVAQDAASGSAYARITVAAADPKPVINGVTLTTGTYTIWYESEISKKNQLSLVEEYGLLGAGSWSLGQEDTRVWNYYSLWLNGWTFEDSQGHWAVPYIIDAADQGKMTGLSATAFGPDRTLTRGEHGRSEEPGLQSLCRNGHIHGYVSAADYQNVVSLFLVHPLIYFHQELKSEFREFLTVKPQYRTLPGSGSIEYVVIFLLQVFCLYIFSHGAVHAELDSHLLIGFHHLLHIGLGKTIVGNSIGQHAARFFHFIDQGHIMTCFS